MLMDDRSANSSSISQRMETTSSPRTRLRLACVSLTCSRAKALEATDTMSSTSQDIMLRVRREFDIYQKEIGSLQGWMGHDM